MPFEASRRCWVTPWRCQGRVLDLILGYRSDLERRICASLIFKGCVERNAYFWYSQRRLGRGKLLFTWCLSSCSHVFVYANPYVRAKGGQVGDFGVSSGASKGTSAEPFLSSLASSGALGAFCVRLNVANPFLGYIFCEYLYSPASHESRI